MDLNNLSEVLEDLEQLKQHQLETVSPFNASVTELIGVNDNSTESFEILPENFEKSDRKKNDKNVPTIKKLTDKSIRKAEKKMVLQQWKQFRPRQSKPLMSIDDNFMLVHDQDLACEEKLHFWWHPKNSLVIGNRSCVNWAYKHLARA